MKIFEIATGSFLSTQLDEGKEGKNTHLEHLEDNIFNRGHTGAVEAVNYLYSLHQMLQGHTAAPISMTTKWDGSPAIICGKDPATGKFFVGTKGVFAKNPKMNFTVADIRKNHPDAGLQEILIVALNNLKKLNIKTVIQGDMLWKKGLIRSQTIDGEQYITFKPNTIVYAVPADSDMARAMQAANMGIVFHTEYVGGPTLADTNAKFGFDSSTLSKTPSVWFRDAKIRDLSGTATLTKGESDELESAIAQANGLLTQIGEDTFKWLEEGSNVIGKDFVIYLKAHINANIKNAGAFEQDTNQFARSFLDSYLERMQNRLADYKSDKKKEEAKDQLANGVRFIREHLPDIVAVYQLYLLLIEAKLVIVRKLETIRQLPTFKQVGDEFVATGEEGFVAVDHLGNALKLIDRLEFSKLNFAGGKPGSREPAPNAQ